MPTIRVATYNVYLGADLTVIFAATDPADLSRRARAVFDQVVATDFPARAAAIARLLVRDRVDLVGLQEVARWSRQLPDAQGGAEVWLDFLEELLGALSAAGQAYDVHACTPNFRGGAEVAGAETMSVLGHNVVLVRRGSGVLVTEERAGAFEHTLDIATPMPELVLNVARSWAWVDAEVDGRRLRFVNTHLEAWDRPVRRAQRDELLRAIGDPDRPVVVVGDFNEVPELVDMPSAYADAWVAAGGTGEGLTCGHTPGLDDPASTTESRIDYVWVRGAAVERCWVVGDRPEDRTGNGLWPSDHAGVLAEIRLG